ncbi:MAG: uncharacterized LabA/DUF88 family protein [Candidatus Saccharimonadales bacterium]|jgi:uncharacterized LabA/DUF88 family protein
MSQQQKRRFPFRRGKQQGSKPKKPNYAFIDSQNLNLGVQRAGWKMDWKKFRQFLTDEYGVEKAFMFIGYIPDNESLYQQMKDAGYLVVLKPTVDMFMTEEELKDEKHVTKGNADAELVLYSMIELNNYDQAVIVSGDGDFYCIVEYLAQKNKLKALLAPNLHYSTLYRPYVDNVVVLEKFRKLLSYGSVKRTYKKKKS